jgi:uncharacterized protein (DUF302 family)
MTTQIAYGFKKEIHAPLEEAEQRVRAALKEEGFGVLTEIDIRGAFKEKIGVDFRPYRILGACNPPLAHQALSSEVDIGLLLPCNVVVYEGDEPGTTVVAALDPVLQLGVSGREDMGDLADDVRARLERVIDAL